MWSLCAKSQLSSFQTLGGDRDDVQVDRTITPIGARGKI